MLARPLGYGRVGIGCMVMYDATALQTIDAVDQYHGVLGFSEGAHSEGFTFLASDTGAITDTENNGGVLRCTDVAHGLTTGQYITVTGMGDALHVGSTGVTVITVDVFDCDDIAYNSINDVGNWQRGSSLTVQDGFEGTYVFGFSCSWSSAAVLKNYKFEPVVNNVDSDEIVFESKIGTANDLASSGAGGHEMLAARDVIWLQMKGTTDNTNATLRQANFHITLVK